MILYFNCNYSLDILNGKSKMLRTGSVVREGQSFGAAFFDNISVSGRVQIHRIIICPKLYNYIYSKLYKISFPPRMARIN
jgi:hypothetical protein